MENKLENTTETTKEFTYQFLERITDDFSKERIVGRGGFGIVYKGVLDNGEHVAVKKLIYQPGLGDDQFKNELVNLIGVQHQNIVQLIGYCYETRKKLFPYNGNFVFAECVERALCLEYLQGGSLDDHLSDEPCSLEWSITYGIVKGICEGLKHLHTGSTNPIYHLDLKPANILLDEDMIPKIGDFGLSRLLVSTQTCVTQTFIGTRGYMPPEYIDKQEITPKFDVFSLGVIILQIMAGRSGHSESAHIPSGEFIEFVHENWRKRLQATMSADISQEVKICIEIALKCVESDRLKRPTINQIVDELDKIDNAKSSSTGQVTGSRKKRDFNKLYKSSDSTMGFNDDEPITIAPPNSVQLVMKNNKEAPLEENDQKVMLELTGDDSSVDRPGLDLVAVLDVSGSMTGHKIQEMKTAMQFVVRKLCPIDRLSIVIFNSDATRMCPLRRVTKASHGELQEMVDSLMARGGTNMEAGLKTGMKVLTDRKVSDGRVVGIMLLSDGQQNSRTDAARVPVGNVPVYTFSFGKDADSYVLNTVAANSMGGMFSFARDGDGVTIAFSQCLAGLLTVAAQDLYLTVTASRVGDESTTIKKITTGSYLQTQHSDDPGSMTIAFGHLYNKEVRKVIVYLSLPAVESERSADILKVTYSYNRSSGREFVAPPATLTVLRTGVAIPEVAGPVEVRAEEFRLQAAELIKEARMLADAMKLVDARYKLMDALDLVADQSNPLLPAELQELLHLMDSQELYHGHGRAYALASETSHDRQRFAARGGDAGTIRLFATPRMDKYLKQAKMFESDPASPVTSADDDVKEEIALTINLRLCSHCNEEEMRRLSLDTES
ncbi:uncharacterized protein [Lolium perenne]|uniref:uncharacterized protein n=1 Tax=Lolium perenne TaxID=4522 RepID=UPI0021F67E9C|nr:probable E3 ubiquitin-protein ligase WAVH2 [Lolium perenne]